MIKAVFRKQYLQMTYFLKVTKKKDKQRSKGGIIGMVLLFAFCFFSVGMAFVGMSEMTAPTLFNAGVGWIYFVLMQTIAVALGVFGSIFTTYSGLYRAKDNEQLLSLPIPPKTILLTRMLSVYVMDFIFTFVAIIPTWIYWFRGAKLGVSGIIFSILLPVFFSIFSLTLSCALGWVVALIGSKIHNKSIVTVFLTLLFLGVYYFVYFRASELLNRLLEKVLVLGASDISPYNPFWLIAQAAMGKVIPFLAIVVIIVALFLATWSVLSKNFIKLATTNRGAKKVEYKKETADKMVASNAKSALLRREFKHLVSSPTYMMNSCLGVLILPLGAVLLLIKGSALAPALDMIASIGLSELIPAAAATLVMFAMSMTVYTAPSISIEGKSICILQSLPVDPKLVFGTKLRVHELVAFVPAVPLLVALCIVCKFDLSVCIVFVLCCYAFAMCTGAFGLFVGIRHANLDWTNEAYAVKQGAAPMLGIFAPWGFLILFCGIYILGTINEWFVLEGRTFLTVLLVIFAVLYRIFMKWVFTKGVDEWDTL